MSRITQISVGGVLCDIGGTEYTAGTGIAISDGELSVKIDGSTITADSNGVLSASSTPGTEYTAGSGITIDSNNAISVNIDNDTITATGGVLEARGGRDLAVNRKTADGEEIDSGERPYGTYTDENGVTYKTYSRIIYIPKLPDTAGITAYNHGIDNIKQIIDIYGFTTDGFVLNAPRQTVSDNITIYQTSKGSKTFSIEVGKDRSNKQAYVTVIYAKNN